VGFDEGVGGGGDIAAGDGICAVIDVGSCGVVLVLLLVMLMVMMVRVSITSARHFRCTVMWPSMLHSSVCVCCACCVTLRLMTVDMTACVVLALNARRRRRRSRCRRCQGCGRDTAMVVLGVDVHGLRGHFAVV